MNSADRRWIAIALPCAAMTAMTIATPFVTGAVSIGAGDGRWSTDFVTEAQKADLAQATGLTLLKGSRFLVYGEDDGRDLATFYKLRLNDRELHALLAQRPLQEASWVPGAANDPRAALFPGWNPGHSRKARTTQVSIERPKGETTYLNVTTDPSGNGTHDVYLELSFS